MASPTWVTRRPRPRPAADEPSRAASRYGVDRAACRFAARGALVAGILDQSGVLFIQMILGQSDRASTRNTVTNVGAVLLTGAIVVLVNGMLA